MTTKRFFSVCAIALAVAGRVAALEQQAFVAGWPIEAPNAARFFDVPLNAEIYATAAGVEQIAVLDANGAPLPFYLRSPPPPGPMEGRTTLDASPLYSEATNAVAAVGVTTADRQTAVTVTSPGDVDPKVVGFVVDARDVETAPVALELDWRTLPRPFLVDIVVEQSMDLTAWRRVGGAAVAALEIGDNEVREARVRVDARAGGYYRLTAGRGVADWYLLRVTLVSAAPEPPDRLAVSLSPLTSERRPESADERAVYFDANGVLPVSAMSLDFPSDGGWLRADVAASDSLDGPWTPLIYGELFYSLDFEGRRFASAAHVLGRRPLRYWRVQPTASSSPTSFSLRLEYPREYLRVAANGEPPYLLAAGTRADEAGPDATFLAVWEQLPGGGAAAVPQAVLGMRRELGGAAALVRPREIPWRMAALWAVLGGGVLVVGWMAVRLAREMRSKPT